MVRPSEEGRARPLTDSESIAAGDGTLEGSDGIDIDTGEPGSVGTGGGASGIHFESAASGTITPDWSDAPVWDLTLVGDIAIEDATGWPASGLEGIIKLVIRQDGTGGWDITSWGSAYQFPDADGVAGGSPPTIHDDPTAQTVVYLQTEDGGSTVGVSSDSAGGGGGPVALDDLTDVDTSGVSDGDLLSYDLGSTTWVPVAAPSGSVPSGTDPGDLLVWDGDSWEVLPVGTDGQVIYADSGETLGLLWDDAPTGGGGGGGMLPLDVPPTSAHAKDDEFNGTSLDGKWTNPATSTRTNTIIVGNGALYLEPSDAGTGSTGSHGGYGIRQAAPASDFTIMAKVAMICPSGSAGETRAGIFVADTGTPKVNILGTIRGGFGRLVNADGATYSESSDWSGYDGYDAFVGPEWLAPVWLRIRWVVSSSTLFFDFSANGYIWQNLNSRGSSVQPNRIGIVQWSNGTDIPKDNMLAVDWFRVTEP